MENEKKFTTKVLAEIAIMATLAFALDALQGGIFKGLFYNGGSIGIAMLPILILTFRRGFVPGLIAAFVLSFLQMLGGVYAIADTWYNVFLQIMLDYVVAYPLVCLAAIFIVPFRKAKTNKEKVTMLVLATTIGGLGKFLSHFLAGVIFWASNTPDGFPGGPWMYSLVYNGGYMLPNIIINAIILSLIVIKQPGLLIVEEKGEIKYEA